MHLSSGGNYVQLRDSHIRQTPRPLMSLHLHPPLQNGGSRQHRPLHSYTPPTITLNQPPDPETRHISKQHFKLIQAVHHKHIIDRCLATHSFPPGMLRQVQRLTDFIKPSTPSENTRMKVKQNTTQWMSNNMTILQDHYTTTISNLANTAKNPLALQISLGWARKRYGTRLTPDTIQTVELILANHTPQISTSNSPTILPHPPQTETGLDRPLSPIPEAEEEEDDDGFPALPKAQAPHKLSLYLGPRTSLSEHIASYQKQPHPVEQQPTQMSSLPVYTPRPHPKPTSHPPLLKVPRSQTPWGQPAKLPLWSKPLDKPPTPTQPPTGATENNPTASPPYSPTNGQGIAQPPESPYQPPPRHPPHLEQDTKEPSQACLEPEASTPLPQRPQRHPSRMQQHNIEETDLETPNPEFSPIFPINTHRTITPSILTSFSFPQQPQLQDTTAAPPAEPHRPLPPINRGKTLEIEAQIHVPPQVRQTSNNNLDTITLSSNKNSNVSVTKNDSISSPGLSPTGRTDGRSSPVGQPVSLNPKKQLKNPSVRLTSMMIGAQKVILTTSAHSEPSTQTKNSDETPLPDRPVPGPRAPTSLGRDLPPSPPSRPTHPLSSPAKFRPTYHLARQHRKLQDWSFKGRRPILILGDSNINRIPYHTNPQIQLDSYPGAAFYHFLKVCEKTPRNPSTKIVVFSVGLNNRDQDPKQTSIKQLRALSRQAESTFPNAIVYFPIMNFSPNLTRQQQDNLRLLNNHIATHYNFLAEIPHDTFQTEPDNIHWTPTTAQHIFEYWCKQLNL